MKVLLLLTLLLAFVFSCQKAKPHKITGTYSGIMKITESKKTIYTDSSTEETWEINTENFSSYSKTIDLIKIEDEIVFSENNDYRLGIDSLEFNREYTIYHLPENSNQIKMNLVLNKGTVNYTEYNIGLTDLVVDGSISEFSEISIIIEFSGTK